MIEINNFQKGQSASPYTTDGAYAKSANVDVFSQLGILQASQLPVKKSGSTITELITSIVRDPNPPSTDWYSPSNTGLNKNDWTNPTNAYTSDDNYATTAAAGYQDYYDFSISVPTSSTITGIEVQAEIKVSSGTEYMTVYLSKDGANYTSGKSVPITTTEQYVSIGGNEDLWGTTWTPTEVNSIFFVKIHALSNSVTYSLDHLRVKIYYKGDTIYAAGENGNIYKSTDSGDTWSLFASSKGKYLAIWKNYLVGALNTELYFYNLSTDSWDTFWYSTPLNNTTEHFMLVSENDGNLYICDEYSVASLVEAAGKTFDPIDTTTYSWNAENNASSQALTLYKPYKAVVLAEQKQNLLVGASEGLSSDPKNSSSIFVWNRATNSYDYPIFLSGEFVTDMKNIQNRVYIATDKIGKIYLFSESGLRLLSQIPFDYTEYGIRIGHKGHQSILFWRNEVLIGVSSEDGLTPAGIYSLYGKSINNKYLISTGEEGDSDVLIGAMFAVDSDTLIYGYYDEANSEYGIDKISTTGNRASGYRAYIESIFYPLGTKFQKANIDKIEVELSRALRTNEGVRIKYRRNMGDSWTTLGIRDYSTDKAQTLLHFTGIKLIEGLQLRIELTGSATSPQIRAIRL